MYQSKLNLVQTELGIKLIKEIFTSKLSDNLNLTRVSAPKFLKTNTGIQDDLAGSCVSVKFIVKNTGNEVELVHSLAKWKRLMLKKYNFPVESGLWTDMDAIRKDEILDNIHSIYVDQYDWEKYMSIENRTLEYLKKTVRQIYEAIKETQYIVQQQFHKLTYVLPDEITFIHTEDIQKEYPDLTPKEREYVITKKYKAVFLIGIGYPTNGNKHDIRAVDYDDWITLTNDYHRGLNGDLLVWDYVNENSLEISSMGIRVNAESLKQQMELMNFNDVKYYHNLILNNELPQSIGGGIGQSRLAMLLLEKKHIGEVQVSIWPDEMIKECEASNVFLL